MNLQSNDFDLFGLPNRFAQDASAIDLRWKELQRQAHPDRFASQGLAAQRVAMQWSVRINEAYQRLKDPLKRAVYLCELHGAPVNAESNTAMPEEFLLQQMSWRESLDEAASPDELDRLKLEVLQTRESLLQKVEHMMDSAQDFPGAAGQVRALMFVERFAQDIDRRQDQQTH